MSFPKVRVSEEERKFKSPVVEETVRRVQSSIGNEELAWMFGNCFPNTLDTTVDFQIVDGRPDTYVITGDINAMWLRDSTAQVWPYLPFMSEDPQLQHLIAGVINRQTRCILLDPYANAFYRNGNETGKWQDDDTDMRPGVHERKWEIDSLCYAVRLAYGYWKTIGDESVFSKHWKKAALLIVQTFKKQQRKTGLGPYSFHRKTDKPEVDTLCNNGTGRPLHPVGLINSSFRPSDDACIYGFLVPANLFAGVSLRQLAEISEQVLQDQAFASECIALADEVDEAVQKYAIVKHQKYGDVYAYEIDGFGNAVFMDDANIPSLLSLPYLGCVDRSDPVYQNTRRLILSEDNPWFSRGKVAEGIGGPHVGTDMIWPMSIIMQALTSTDEQEIRQCLGFLQNSHAGTGFMHETFHKDNAEEFTRPWFAWANTLFGELILKVSSEYSGWDAARFPMFGNRPSLPSFSLPMFGNHIRKMAQPSGAR